MKFLDWLVDATHAISRVSAWCAGAFMLFTALMVSGEVVARKLGSALITGASEVGGYMLAICSVWAFSYTLLHRSHIRFDILYARCGPRTRGVLDLVALIAVGVFACIVTYHSYAVLATSIGFNARSVSSLAIPIWIPQSVWFAGLVFLCWTSFILAVRVLVALLQGDLDTVNRLAGTIMAKDEAEQEANDALQKPGAAHEPLKVES
jgi:TRAP-type mannitol/chloroaromatic compound transport system permease small subunit